MSKNSIRIIEIVLAMLAVFLLILILKESFDLKAENEQLRSALAEKAASTNQTATTVQDPQTPSIAVQNPPTSSSTINRPVNTDSYEIKREKFASKIKQALNAPGLPEMCTDAYFNSLGELIIEVNGEWLILDDELKKDMIYALKELLAKSKEDLNVEGYGQFFSDSGRALEAFYAD